MAQEVKGVEKMEEHPESENCASPKTERQKLLETLFEPPPPLPEYIGLALAAERLRCTLDDLLGKGVNGKLDFYAPVLEEGAYVWPVTDRGIQHSRTIGDADPVFMARLQLGDYGILSKTDIKKIKLGAEIVPEGYICPSMTLRLINELEDELHAKVSFLDLPLPESVIKRMTALARQVPWVPVSGINSKVEQQSSMGRMVGVNMLRLVADDVPQCDEKELLPEPILTRVLKNVFSHSLSKLRAKQAVSNWDRTFSEPPKSLKSARVEVSQGREAKWDPVLVGIWLNGCGYTWSSLNRVFESNKELQAWRLRWVEKTEQYGNDAPETGHQIDQLPNSFPPLR